MIRDHCEEKLLFTVSLLRAKDEAGCCYVMCEMFREVSFKGSIPKFLKVSSLRCHMTLSGVFQCLSFVSLSVDGIGYIPWWSNLLFHLLVLLFCCALSWFFLKSVATLETLK